MELTAYLHPGWTPLIRPAPATRSWMDNTPESFAYRCLPLNIANAHGWEVLCPIAFDAIWDGGTGTEAISIKPSKPGTATHHLPESLFGQGIITFHIEAIIRTPPGWSLSIGGSPNRPKDAIAPLSGIVETDWSPFTFTMNWQFTRLDKWVHFDAMEAFCFLFPIERAAIEAFEPAFVPLHRDPDTEARFKAWSRSRDAFQDKVQREPPKLPADRWQKHYYQGIGPSGEVLASDHRTKLRLKPFDRTATPDLPIAPADDEGLPPRSDMQRHSSADPEIAALRRSLAKRDWLLETMERQRSLLPGSGGIERRYDLTGEEFLEQYYAPGRPVILCGEMEGWPALNLWNPNYLKLKIGSAVVEYQSGRSSNPGFEMDKERHRCQGPFNEFIDLIETAGTGNDVYLTAYNSACNSVALNPLIEDVGSLGKFLSPHSEMPHGMIWIGPAGTVTSLHHDLTNNFIAQFVGRKRIKLLPASEVGKVYNNRHVFSEIADLDDPGLDLARYPRLAAARAYEGVLEPGEILFMPIAWWHQVTSLDFSVTITYTNFLWPNDAYETYPGD